MNETPVPPQEPTSGGPHPATGSGAPDQTPGQAGPAAPQPPYAQQPYPQPPYGQPPYPQRSGVDSFFDGIRRSGIVRSDERWVGGVAGGVALRLGIDPLVVRGLFGVSVLLGGLGLILYGLGWLLLPEQRDGRIHLQQLFRGDFDVAVLGGFAAFVTGISFPGSWFPGNGWMGDRGWFTGLLWLTAVVVVVALIVSASRNRAGSGPSTTMFPGGAPQPGTGPAHTPGQPGQPFGVPTAAAAAPPRRPEGPTTTMPPTTPYPSSGQPHSTYPASGYPSTSYSTSVPPVGTYPAAGQPAPYSPGGPRNVPVTTLPRAAVSHGPGAGAMGIVVALSLITLATLLYLDRTGQFTGPVLLTAGAITVVLLGIGIIVAGLRGRTSGGFGGLAVVALIVLIPLAAVQYADWDGDWDTGTGTGTAFGDLDRTPTSVATAEAGYSLGAGEARIDLTELPLSGPVIEVPVEVGAGEVTIVLPQDSAYTAEISVGAGEVVWLGDTVTSGIPGDRGTEPYESDAVRDGATPDLALDIAVGFGTVTVVEEGR